MHIIYIPLCVSVMHLFKFVTGSWSCFHFLFLLSITNIAGSQTCRLREEEKWQPGCSSCCCPWWWPMLFGQEEPYLTTPSLLSPRKEPWKLSRFRLINFHCMPLHRQEMQLAWGRLIVRYTPYTWNFLWLILIFGRVAMATSSTVSISTSNPRSTILYSRTTPYR